MKDNKLNPFKLDFDSYILQSEPEKQENGKLWKKLEAEGLIVDNMLCLLIFLQKRGFSLKLGKTNLTKALPKCKKETQHGNYNLCRNGCPQRQLFIMLL